MAVLTVPQVIDALLIRELLMASKTFGMRTAARMAMTASTPIISISVKACLLFLWLVTLLFITLTWLSFFKHRSPVQQDRHITLEGLVSGSILWEKGRF